MRKMRYGSAPGPDRIPTELLKALPGSAAAVIFPILMKFVCRLEEPLQWKGGNLFSLFKGRGAFDVCENHRGILLTSVLGKALRASYGERLNLPYLDNTDQMQLGGKPAQQAVFGTQVSRALLLRAKLKNRSVGLIFGDVPAAYYRVLRQVATGARLNDTGMALVLNRMGLSEDSLDLL